MAPISGSAHPHAKENAAALSLCIMSKPSSNSSSQSMSAPASAVRVVPPTHFLAPVCPSLHSPVTKTPPPKVQKERSFHISVEEMSRLMRVYGPIKSVRVRNTDRSKPTKETSIKRKFYRWFPDFGLRFELTSRGWYRPKIGHDAEMRYRAEMREKNEMTMITLRAKKRRENHLKKI